VNFIYHYYPLLTTYSTMQNTARKYKVGQKNRTCLSVDNSVMVNGKRRVIHQKFQNAVKNK